MNEILQQLVSLGPGLGAAAKGNGEAFAAFMDGYQRTLAQMETHQRARSRDQLDQQELQLRQQQMEQNTARQAGLDARAAEDQQWQREDRATQQQQRLMAFGDMLSKAGAGAETLPEAESSVDSTFGLLTPDQQAQLAPVRDRAMVGAQRAISGRQKNQAIAFLKLWEESEHAQSFIDAGQTADRIMINLPDHMQQYLGKPQATLAEVQQFAALPVGTPAKKKRTPAAAGSFEDYVQRKYGDAATPEQILAARKEYQQSDDKPTVNVTLPGGISGKAGDAALKFQDDYARDSKPWVTIRDAYQRVKSAADTPTAAGDLSMIFAYMKMLDPNSVVREQEFANAQNAAGVPDRVRNIYNRVVNGNRLAPEQRAQFLEQAEGIMAGARTNQRGVRQTYGDRAKQWGIPDTMVLDKEDPLLADPPKTPPPAGGAAGPAPGTRKRSPNGDLIEWDGKGWFVVRP